MKKHIKNVGLLFGLLMMMCLPATLLASPANAQEMVSCPALGNTIVDKETCEEATNNYQQWLSTQNPEDFDLGRDTGNRGEILGISCNNESTNIENHCIYKFAVAIVNWLAAGVGVAVVGGIIYGSIVYATSGGAADRSKQGINIITNALIALLVFFLMWAAINFLVPGGLFR